MTSLDTFDARPGQTLQDHLDGVATNVSRLLAGAGTTSEDDDWQTVGRVLAWTHDAGKLTEWFQDYLATNDRSVAPTHEHTYHGRVSALLTAHVLHALDVAPETRKAGFYAVAKHHGVLPNVPAEDKELDASLAPRNEDRFTVLGEQLKNIDQTAAEAADTLLDVASDGALGWADVRVDSPEKYGQLATHPKDPSETFYETVLRAWSTLVCADKLDAANITVANSPCRPALGDLVEHVKSLPEGETERTRQLNKFRSAAHEEAKKQIQTAHESGDRLFRITLPTGFGKTLTGLRAGLELAEDRNSRVIYSLPYTSIIDQVDGEVRDIFSVAPGDKEYTIHHHLADTWTRLVEGTDSERVSDGSESLYAETWQSGLVLTTFVQLFESLAGPTNVQSMKLPALQDSIIIVDEPQAISLRWWALVGRLADYLRREYDATLVLMTATQPEIFDRDQSLPSPTSLTTQFADCCTFIADNPRVEYTLHESLTAYLDAPEAEPLSLPEAAETLVDDAESDNQDDTAETTLAITNTVESAASLTEHVMSAATRSQGDTCHLADSLLAFYRDRNVTPSSDTSQLGAEYLHYLTDRTTAEPDMLVGTLTARLRPVDRSLLLSALRHRLGADQPTPFDDVPLLTISTQLIEAGVDISFDRLYRDLGPVPALVQAAGRCNRNFSGTVSPVTLWRLAPAETEARVPSEQIYGARSLLRPARQALQTLRNEGTEQRQIPEAAMISNGISTYYENLHDQRQTASRTSDLVEAFDTADGAALREASLIEEHRNTQEVAVIVSDADCAAQTAYQSAHKQGDWVSADDALDYLKQLFISMPVESDGEANDTSFATLDVTRREGEYTVRTGRGVVRE